MIVILLANDVLKLRDTVGCRPRKMAVCGLKSAEGVFQSHGLRSEAEQPYNRD